MRTWFYLIFALFLSLILSTTSIAQTSWNWSNPRPQGNDIWGVTTQRDSLSYLVGDFATTIRRVGGRFQTPTFAGSHNLHAASHYADTVWAVGDSGTIYRSINNGTSWTNESTSFNKINFRGVFAFNRSNAITVGDSGYILATTNGGTNWVRETNSDHRRLNAIRMDSATGYAVGDNGAFLRGNSLGAFGWISESIGTTNNLRGISLDSDNLYVVGDNGFFMRRDVRQDTAVTDTNFSSSLTLYDVYYSNPYVVIVGAGGAMLRSTNQGVSWSSPVTNTTQDLYRIEMDTTAQHFGYILVVGQQGVILRSSNFGQTWSRLDTGSRAPILAMASSPNGSLYATSNTGSLFSSSNYGVSWRRDSITNTFGSLLDIQIASSGFGLMATNGAGVLVTTDSGRTWQAKTIPNAQVLGVATTRDSVGIAVGPIGAMYRSVNKGATWVSVSTGSTKTLYDVDCYGANAIAVGYGGAFLYSHDAGATWSTGSSTATAQMNRVRFSTVNTATAVGVVGNIWHTGNAGASWTSAASGTNVTLHDIAWHDDVNGIIVGAGGLVLKTHNGATNWSKDALPTAQDLYGALVTSGTDAFVGGNLGVILSTSNSTLPVELVSLAGVRLGPDRAEIDWKVASQASNDGFTIDRLETDWREIGKVPVTTPDGGSADFTFVDNLAPTAQTRYRVIQHDLDGSAHILGEVEINASTQLAQPSKLLLWPNPASDRVDVSFAAADGAEVRAIVYNMLGVAVATQVFEVSTPGTHSFELQLGAIPAGSYRMVIESGSTRQVTPLAILR